jgi:hypothetical protein
MTLDGSAAVSGAAVRVTGRVQSLRSDAAARQTEVVLADEAGLEVARFMTLGARSGRIQWVAEGAPSFVPGERVEVALLATNRGYALARVPEGESAVRRLAPGSSGLDGAAFERAALGIPSTVTDLAPSNGGAVPDDPFTVSVRGAGFGATQGDSRVTFQGIFERVDAAVVSWSDKEIVCRVPAPGLKGDPQVLSGPIKVWTPDGGWSDGDPFVGGSRFSVLYQWAGDSWPLARLPIAIWTHPDGSPFAGVFGDLVTEAASQWNVPGAFAHLVYRGTTPVTGGNHGDDDTPEDGRNTVTWRNDWPYAPTILALTWSAIDTVTFERREVEMEINGTRPWTLDPEGEPNKFDLISTMTHEFGHWLRLGHTQNVPSVMLAFASPGERRRQISVGDAFGASWIHPSSGIASVPVELATGGARAVRVAGRDREGLPLPQLFKGVIEVQAIRLGEGEAVGPLDPQLDRLPEAAVNADADTDDEGRTTVTMSGLADGRYRVETTIDNRFVRPASVLRVGPAPVPVAPALALSGVTPSPLVPGARGRVSFTLPFAGDVTLDLYDARGRRARSIVSGRMEAGPHDVTIETIGRDGRTLGAGVYFLRLAGGALGVRTSRVVLLP